MRREDPWQRASLEFHTRPNRAPRNVSRSDLTISQGPGSLKMLGLTFVAGAAMTALFVWPVMMVIAILTNEPPSSWFWVPLVTSVVVLWLTLYTFAVRESAADKRYAEQLHLP